MQKWLVVERKGNLDFGRSRHYSTEQKAEERKKELTPTLGGMLLVVPAKRSKRGR